MRPLVRAWPLSCRTFKKTRKQDISTYLHLYPINTPGVMKKHTIRAWSALALATPESGWVGKGEDVEQISRVEQIGSQGLDSIRFNVWTQGQLSQTKTKLHGDDGCGELGVCCKLKGRGRRE